MAMVGHKTESIYRRYAIVAESDLRAGTEKIQALHDCQTGQDTKRRLIYRERGESSRRSPEALHSI